MATRVISLFVSLPKTAFYFNGIVKKVALYVVLLKYILIYQAFRGIPPFRSSGCLFYIDILWFGINSGTQSFNYLVEPRWLESVLSPHICLHRPRDNACIHTYTSRIWTRDPRVRIEGRTRFVPPTDWDTLGISAVSLLLAVICIEPGTVTRYLSNGSTNKMSDFGLDDRGLNRGKGFKIFHLTTNPKYLLCPPKLL